MTENKAHGYNLRCRAIVSSAAARLYHVVFKSYYSNLSIQGYPIFKIAGKSKSVMGAGEPEEIGEIKKNPEVLQNIE